MAEFSEQLNREIDEAAELILSAKYLVGLTGAGVSVESGIPPFRGLGGLWTKHGEPPMDGYQRFLADPKGHWENRIKRQRQGFYQSMEAAKSNPGHYALAELEKLGILKCLITQNVDNLHRAAGSVNLAEIHGNFVLDRCISCGSRFRRGGISLEVLPPRCPKCGGLVKGDGVAFGEPIPLDVLVLCQSETDKCDCMLVAGTSAMVYPAAGFPQEVWRRGGPLIEVNLYESELTRICRISLRGQTGTILPELLNRIKVEIK